MKSHLTLAETLAPTPVSAQFSGQISGFDAASKCWLIDDYFLAKTAMSLLAKPQVGDKVFFIELDQQYYIVQLLTRDAANDTLVLETDKNMQWVAPQIRFSAFESIEMVSLNKVSVMGRTLVHSAENAMIQQAAHMVQKVEQYSLTAKGVLQLSAKQQVIIAEEDVRIDGKRISIA